MDLPQFGIKDIDFVCIGRFPVKPPGPPRPRLSPLVLLRVDENGILQTYTSTSKLKLDNLSLLDTGRSAGPRTHETATTTSTDEAEDAGCHKPTPPKYTRREALVIQSKLLKFASDALSLQQAAVDTQLKEFLGVKDEDEEEGDGEGKGPY